ncbi:hypothetical protein EI94DRAFT_1596422 [Lactarius quietus]|nr:hypothetical protein EI94DRAFT_1596422 [Lactarius quietus]
MGISNHVDKKAAKVEHFDCWKTCSFQKVQEDAQKWRSATSVKERKRLYNKTSICHSVLMELEYWDLTIMVPIDGMHNFFLGLLQYHAQTVLGMDTAESWNEKATEMLKQVEEARVMLSDTSLDSLDLRRLMVEVLKIFCEERGISIVGQSKWPCKEDLIKLLKVRKHSHLTSCTHGSE